MFRTLFHKLAYIAFIFVFLAAQTPAMAMSSPESGLPAAPEVVVLAAPGTFNKITPVQNATGQPRDMTLTWGASSGATRYDYCYDTAATGACTGTWNFAGTSTSASLTMPPGTTFYWQVRATNGTGTTYADGSETLKWRFDLLPDPGAFNKTAPANQAINQPVNGLNLTWSPSDNAASYQYCLNTTGTSCTGSWTAANSTTVTLNNLTPGATYYWQVQAVNSAKTVDASNAWWSFSIAPAPGGFSKSSPVDNATGQSITPTISWAASSNATGYEYCTSATATCTSGLWLGTGTATTAVVSAGLAPGSTTFWQVRATNPSGSVQANGGAWWKMTAAPLPGSFNKTTPANGAIDQPITNMVLNWGASANATKYEYCYDTAASGACTGTWINALTSQTATISATLLPNTLYRWQVRASTINGVVYANGLDTATYSFRTLPPPVAFGKTAPANLATGLTNNKLVLTWGASSAGVVYEYCYNTTASCPETSWITTSTATTATLPALTPGSVYYWQVRALNGSGTVYADGGTWWSFTTRLTPDDFSKTSPANGAVDRAIAGLQLSWEASGNASSYEYCLNTIQSCTEPWISTGTNRTVNAPTLNPGVTYYWQVRARNVNGTTNANASTWWSFTTLPLPGAFAKNPAETYYPADNHWVIEWSASAKATSYAYCVSTTSGTCPGNNWSTPITALTASLPGLTPGTTYYWQVRALNSSGPTYADGGIWESFTTTALPASFSKTAPANGATAQVISNLQLSWGTSTGATSYEYCVSTSSSCANGIWTTATSPATIPSLLPGITYYWQVRARNGTSGATEANDGTWWSFTTKAFPGPFKKSAPANNAINQPINNLVLNWGASSNATRYDYCVSTSPACSDTAWKSANTALTATVTPALLPGTVYYWQVRAYNSFGYTYADDEVWWTFTTRPLPGAFNKSAPATGSSGRPINGLVLTWGDSTNFDSYEYCYSTTNGTCPGDAWITNGTNKTVTLPTLQAGTTYYWQARAKNTNGYKYANDDSNASTIDWWTFATLPAPGTFGKSSPANNAVGQPTTGLVLTWGTSISATSYEYCFSTTATCPGDSWTSTGTAQTATLPTTLTAGTRYYWQVRARNINGLTMADNAWWTFITLQKPGAFNKAAPGTGATNQPINGVVISWSASSNTSGYQYCYSTSASCPNNNWSDAGTALTFTLPTLSPNTTYYWQVRAWNVYDSTEANGGTWWTFTTQTQAGAFTKTAPTNGVTNQPVTGLVLSWGASSGATGYSYCTSTTGAACPNNAWTTNGTSQTVTLPTLTGNTTYYWQVRASNSTGTTESSGGWWTFTTSQQGPGAFNKSTPANLATSQPISGLVISWGTSANATGYEYCYNTTGSCPNNIWTSAGTATSATLPALANGTSYFWQVRANGANSTTTYANNSTWWSFTTQPSGGAFTKTAPTSGATGQPTSGLVLSWGASANATSYEYCLNTSASCTSWTTTGTNRSVTRNDLLASTKYYWHVRAINGAVTTYADGSGTALWNFTTQGTSKVFLPSVWAPPPYYTIAGKVTLDGVGLSGVTITTNDGKTAVTDTNGNYILSLYAGTYTLTPSKSGYTFTPTSRNVTTPPAATGQNFTATVECSELIKNNSFETTSYWEIPATTYTAGYASNLARTGSWSMRAGIVNGTSNVYSWSSAYQQVYVPSDLTSATLKFWLYPLSGEANGPTLNYPELIIGKKPEEAFKTDAALTTTMYSDVQQAIILDQYGNVLESLLRQTSDTQQWEEWVFDLNAYRGRTIQVYFDVYNDGVGGSTGMYVDDVSLKICK